MKYSLGNLEDFQLQYRMSMGWTIIEKVLTREEGRKELVENTQNDLKTTTKKKYREWKSHNGD